MTRSVAITAFLVAVAVTALPASAWAQQDHSTHRAAALTDGEVRKVDRDAQKITLRHGPMSNLDMPAHTMVFQVADPAMLDQVKPGDRIRFEAEKVGGAFRLTRIERAKE
jgi:Cu(I)/Ag(I) efflux system periplasmic protein CusF